MRLYAKITELHPLGPIDRPKLAKFGQEHPILKKLKNIKKQSILIENLKDLLCYCPIDVRNDKFIIVSPQINVTSAPTRPLEFGGQ